jgi:hypothetical protein
MRRTAVLLRRPGLLLLAFSLLAVFAAAPARAQISAESVASPPGLPPLGKWMIDRDGTVAHWLGEVVNGRRLYEPINVILIDEGAADAEDAKRRLLAAVILAGYPVRFGHSAGYRGLIGGNLYRQLPLGRDDAFSNRIFEESNNHGRIFGPHAAARGFMFIGAFSRESVDVFRMPAHRYASFNTARDDFARDLVARAGYQTAGTVPLGNAVPDNPKVTTGDHDGNAVVLRIGN